MPNLRQLISLKEKYATLNKADNRLSDYLNKTLLDEVAIQKSFSFNEKLFEHFDLSGSAPKLIEYFESKPIEDVVLLFIDISNFSTITENNDNEYITRYLDSYYKRSIPIIYSHGGQIEKLMGDGIICVFGLPFIDVDWPEEFNRAELCAKELIKTFKGTNKEVKVALHSGEINYYKTPGIEYEEYTMIGKPITELFRLESVSQNNAINFYVDSIYDSMRPSTELGLSAIKPSEIRSHQIDVSLQGVDYSQIRFFRFV